METKLLPCPFCGGEARIKARYYRAIDMYDYSGVCKECNASMDVKDTAAEAIEAWNTRHARTCRMEIDWDYDGDCPAYYRDYVCSECKEDFIYYKNSRVSYCPNCGAKVVGE